MFHLLLASGGTTKTAVERMQISAIDLAIVLFYLIGIVLLGCWAGMRQRKGAQGSDYFLAGRSLRWPMIGLALFATNISTIHLVSLAQSGYESGLVYGNFEWMAGFTLVILSLFFAPFYIRAGVATLPDFLEKRYNRACRDFLAVLSIFSAVLVHIGFSLYTGAQVLEGSFLKAYVAHPENYRVLTIVVIAGLTGLYTIVGGLMAVVLTESIQTIVLLLGAICITLLGLVMIGGQSGHLLDPGAVMAGWQELKQSVHPVNMSMLRTDSDPTALSWYTVFAGYWVAGVWYWCTDQTIVQRVLGAKDEHHARVGPLFAGVIKILPVFIFVLPGLICLGLIQKELIPPLPTDLAGNPDTGKTYSHLIQYVLPVGAQGIVLAALLAALMSTVAGALNSIATLFSYDIYKRWKPSAGDRQLIHVGRIATFVTMIIAILWSVAVGFFSKSIFQAMVDLFCGIAPPTTVVFIWGVFWKRASARGAIITLVLGAVIGAVVTTITLMGWNKIGDYEINSLLSLFLLVVLESGIMVVASLLFPQQHTAESESLVWKSPWEALRGPFRGVMDYRVWAVGLLAVMIGLYFLFAGDAYYPIEGQVTDADGRPVVGVKVFLRDNDHPELDYTVTTDPQGWFAYGTKTHAGGFPAGSVVQTRLAPSEIQYVVDVTDAEKEPELLAILPLGTNVRIEQKDGKTVVEIPTASGEPETVTRDADARIEILRPSDVPERYRSFDTADLQLKIEKKKNRFPIRLAEP